MRCPLYSLNRSKVLLHYFSEDDINLNHYFSKIAGIVLIVTKRESLCGEYQVDFGLEFNKLKQIENRDYHNVIYHDGCVLIHVKNN